ncbi:type VI secretion system baseplate subunit TssE [Vibrio rumoiensis]|uniref:type VI secretion system baseplate subunit TssE n=1 Tax=Vibrio rumoiensis TaxID=76258 RepID=UPI000D78771A|nr:type VI secretion system baseplate subunit TssE [Vibrio rumoiensis]
MAYIAPEESAFGISFLERLEADAKPLNIIQAPVLSDVLNSIRNNISNILNTRMGDSQSSPSLGLIDFNDATLEVADLSMTIRLAIKKCLDSYEPRSKNISVYASFDRFDALALRFQILAELDHDAIHKKVKLDLMLDQNKKYRVF